MYRDHRKGPGGPPGGATYPGGPHGLKWEGNQPLVGWCAPPWPPLRLGLETLGWGAAAKGVEYPPRQVGRPLALGFPTLGAGERPMGGRPAH